MEETVKTWIFNLTIEKVVPAAIVVAVVLDELFRHMSAGDESVHRMGGLPNIVQYSRLEFAGDTGAAEWRLLLQLDSEQEAGMMWGNRGKLYFMIRENDLRAMNFEKVSMDWMCG